MTIVRPADVLLEWAPVPPGAARRGIAWGLVRRLVAALAPSAAATPAEVRLANPCPFCGGPHGPVQVVGAPVRASVAYSGEYAFAAVTDAAAGAFAIDAEPADAAPPDDLAPPGPGTIRDWVRVEAVLKADGRGLRVEPSKVRVESAADRPNPPLGIVCARARVPGSTLVFDLSDLSGPAGHLVSAAVGRREG